MVSNSDTSVTRLLRQYIRWHQRDTEQLTEQREQVQRAQQAVDAAQQAATSAQEALHIVRSALLDANHQVEHQKSDLQAAVELNRRATTDCEALSYAARLEWANDDFV